MGEYELYANQVDTQVHSPTCYHSPLVSLNLHLQAERSMASTKRTSSGAVATGDGKDLEIYCIGGHECVALYLVTQSALALHALAQPAASISVIC